MEWILDPRLWTLVHQLLTNNKLRTEVMSKGINAYLLEQGVDISPVVIHLRVDEATHELHVKVENSDDDFKGTLHLEMTE